MGGEGQRPEGIAATTKSGEGGTEVPEGSKEPAAADGCSIATNKSQEGSVEYAAGLVALLASVLGLRRRVGRKDVDLGPSRPRLPSMP